MLSLKNDFIKWPSADERRMISERILSTYGFPAVVGIIDGTHIALTERPEWCGYDFHTRKFVYAIQAMIICDDEAKILYAYSGWPGNVHDQRVWRNTIVAKNPSAYFHPGNTSYLTRQ